MEYLLLFLASVSLVVLVLFLLNAFGDKIEFKTANIIYIYLSICFGLPILYFALNVIFAFLMLWYYFFAAVLVSLGIMSLLKPNLKTYNKIIIVILTVITLYLYYDYRSILEIKFDVILDNKRIFNSNEEY